jgi:hypothetical protein
MTEIDEMKEALKPSEATYRNVAWRLHHHEGDVEIDEDADVSIGDDAGAYAQAWIWIDDDSITDADKKEDVCSPSQT